ncbi:hypothetical protein BN2476_650040 [Paraburkholderia piptadeniae]|uniref:Uncharacterized protein n=1 Tax=Paraburkholderia piptadeniae TaxID=1701573 RepID=A0A1N7SMX9_9BURK|nr:hypothetical protein BN2476_650040 [Paraburkholderia piptadeniae]
MPRWAAIHDAGSARPPAELRYGVAIQTHSASHGRWNCDEISASKRLSLLVCSAYGKRSGHGGENYSLFGATDKKLISLLTEDEADIFIVLLKRLLVNSATHGPADVSAVALRGSPSSSSAIGAPA